MAFISKQKQIEEIVKSGKDPTYFFNRYVKIQHPVKGLIDFETFPFQDDCTEAFIKHRFNVILKSRQLGLSTLVAAYAVWMAIFSKDKNVLIIATKQTTARNVIKKIKVILSSLPSWLLLTRIVTNNKSEIEFSNGSTIKAIPTSEDAGRSEALSLLIVDEAAFIRGFDDLWTALYPTISAGGRAILLSTPNGVGNMYHTIYSNAEAGLNEFNAIKLPWDVHPERDQDWFVSETRNFSERKISQEYLCDFLSSGDTFLGIDDIRWVQGIVKDPIKKEGPGNNVWIWSYPYLEHKYVITADVARGDAKDYSAFHVIDFTTGEIVAEYKGKVKPDNFADLLRVYGEKYGNALICPENNSYGYAVCMKLKEAGYPKMYYQDSRGAYLGDYIPPQDLSKAGFQTNGKTRNIILAKLEEVIRNKDLKIYSSRFVDELKTFIWDAERAQAMKGKNDDLIMSLAIGAWLYEAAGEHSQHSMKLSQVMLQAMGTSKREYTPPEIRGKHNPNPFAPVQPAMNEHIGGDNRVKREVRIVNDLQWLFK